MQAFEPRISSEAVDEEVFVSPPVLSDDGDDEHVIDIELRHVLFFLGGLALAGVIVAIVWEWTDHRLRLRRQEHITAAITSGAHAIATIMVESRRLIQQITVAEDEEE